MKKRISAFLVSVLLILAMLPVSAFADEDFEQETGFSSEVSVSHEAKNAVTGYEMENNDSFANANLLSPGNAVQGSVSTSSDQDYFKIPVSANGKLELFFEHTVKADGSQWEITAYPDNSGSSELFSWLVALDDNNRIELPFIGAVKGQSYYVRIKRDDNGVVGEYYKLVTELTASEYYEKEVNDDFTTATSVNPGDSVQGNISRYYDDDYYKITVPSNGKLELFFEHTVKADNSDWIITAYPDNSGTQELLSWRIALNDSSRIALPYIGAVKDKTYYIKVKRDDSGVIRENYKISTVFTASEYYEKEVNDDFTTATIVAPGTSVEGNLSGYYDEDYYKITATSSETLNLVFEHTLGSSNEGWKILVYPDNSGRETILDTSVCLNDSNRISLCYLGTAPGKTYYVRVLRYNGDDAVGENYKLSFVYNLSKFKLSKTSFTYTGKKIKPSVTVYSGGKKLTSKDYTVTYYNNKNPGKATVVVSGKGSYSGTLSASFKIKPVGTKITKLVKGKKAITVKWKKQAKQTTGYQIQISINKSFNNAKKVTVQGNKKISKKITGLKANKLYYVRIRTYKIVNGAKFYSDWSGVKKIKTK